MKQTIARSIFVVMFVFLVIAGKFAYIQLFQANDLQKQTVEQRVRKVKEMPDRGEIKDNEGRVIAMSLNAKNIAVYPNVIQSKADRENIAHLLSKVLDLPYKDVLKKVETKDKKGKYVPWISIANRVNPEKAQQLKTSKYAGYIEISNAPKRYYPNGTLGSTFLGFVNYQNEPGAGIEMSLNHYLGGIPGYRIAEFDHQQREIPIGNETSSEPVPGEQVTLTVDSYIQYTLEQTLKDIDQKMHPKQMHAIVMDPNTGKILGMASYPSFDPNNYTKAKQDDINRNAASFVYEPGSTFKPIYMANALDGGYIKPDFTFNDTGSINVGGSSIHNWDSRNYGTSNLQDIIIRSSNVGMVNISKQLTSQEIVDGLKKAGIGQKTGIELPNEETGLIPTAKQLDDDAVRKATVSFGQGISITPIRLITSFSQIINGGYKVTPTMIENVQDQYGNTQYEWQQPQKEKVYKDSTVELMKSYLKANFEIGSGKDVQIPGYDGGAKTGSAWKVENGKYASGKIIGSFIGFIPFDHPKYVMLAVVDDPKNVALFGSSSGGPVFKEAMTEILRYKGEPKTVPLKGEKTVEKEKEIKVSDMTYELFDVAKEKLNKETNGKVTITKEGPGEVVIGQDYSYKGDNLVVNLQTANIKGKDNSIYIPNVQGLTKDQVKSLFDKYNIKTVFHGNGTVKYQEKNPGEYGAKINKLVFWCE